MKKTIMTLAAVVLASGMTFAQFRANDKDGLNVFENPKSETTFDGVKVKVGGSFTQSWQALYHSNQATASLKTDPSLGNLVAGAKYDANKLIPIKPGFNNALANLNFDVALADGVDLKMELYLSARHHQETWVKGGYIQFNKLPFLSCDLTDNIMKMTTIKVGHMEVNYGDSHFRRSDNGNSMYNPFIENYIMDAFATEIGGELDFKYNGLIAVAGATTGQISGDISAPSVGAGFNAAGVKDTLTDGSRRPAFLAKIGYDGKLLDEKLRVRLTGSTYLTAGSTGVTLYGGDRGGSHYYGVMDNTTKGATGIKENIAFTSGRYNPSFGDKITSFMGNLLLEYQVLDNLSVESFSTIETSTGRGKTEATGERSANQIASDLIIRFGKDRNFWIAARYNKVNSDEKGTAFVPAVNAVAAVPYTLNATTGKITGTTAVAAAAAIPGGANYGVNIDRLAFSAGWYMTKNVMAKIEYTKQNYGGFLPSDIRNNGKFNGIVAEAVVGF